MPPFQESLDRLAEHYLLEDFAKLIEGLSELSQHLTHPPDRQQAERLRAAALVLAAPECPPEGKPASRQTFEEALAALRTSLANSTPSAPVSSALSQDPELVGDFLLEAREHLQNVESGLLVIEKDPSHRETLHSVFRSFHTIKGLAGFLEFSSIQEVAHEVETILDLARNAQIVMSPSLIDLTLHGADFVQRETNRIEAELHGNTLPADSPAELLERLRAAAQDPQSAKASAAPLPAPSSAPAPIPQPAPVPTATLALAPAPTPPTAPTPVPTPAEETGPPAKRSNSPESYAIRVDTAKLDYLLDMVGEMVIAESMVRLDPDLVAMSSARLQRNLTQLRRVTEEVQKVAMATRMVPVGSLFQRVNRLVRDTSRKAGKLADVEFAGEETQLDKTIIEELTDPIMHMVRNSIDHGIETPDQRQASGKPPQGKIQLKAYRQADHIQIEIIDDGRGLNKEKILAKAVERGLISSGAELPDAEIFQLIFEPGFSTAEKVTDLSGRGVGMDVVKKQIQKLRGKIDIQSQGGRGTTFFLKLPLTLAIIEGLVVGVGRERFIMPIFSVQEMFRPREEQVSTVQGRGEMVMVRNSLLPVIRLADALGVRGRQSKLCDALMVVAETEGKRFVLMVDEFIGKQEVVIKGLGGSLKNTPGVAGGAILGDGRVGLILDLEAIYRDRHHRLEQGNGEMTAPRKESVCLQELSGSLAAS